MPRAAHHFFVLDEGGGTGAGARATGVKSPRLRAFQTLRIGFVLLFALAGGDKVVREATRWGTYVSPALTRASPFDGRNTMLVVGGFEIALALLLATRPRIGAFVAAAWLACIVVNLVAGQVFYDVAILDLALAVGAIALARLSEVYD